MKFIGFYNYTVILTYLGAAAAICGIFLSFEGNIPFAIFCLMFAGLTDMFDGKIASTMKRNSHEKAFGIEIDSLCDLISFGVLPVAIGYGIGLRGPIFYISSIFFVLCAIIRLGYFNVDESERQKNESDRRKIYYGLPVTSSALLFPLLFAIRNIVGAFFITIYQVFLFITAFLFILKFEIKKPHGASAAIFIVIGAVILTFVVISSM